MSNGRAWNEAHTRLIQTRGLDIEGDSFDSGPPAVNHEPVVKIVLARHGISREYLAEVLGVSVDTVNNWCSGRSSMRLRNFAAMLSTLADAGMTSPDMEQFAVELLSDHGLTSRAGQQLLHPDAAGPRKLAMYVAPEVLIKANRLAAMGARGYLRQIGIRMMLTSADDAIPDLEQWLADLVEATHPRGLMVSRMDSEWSSKMLESAEGLGTSTVALFERPKGTRAVHRFSGIDNHEVGHTAGEYLVGTGHTRIGFLGRASSDNPDAQRLDGLLDALSENGLHVSPDHVYSEGPAASSDMVSMVADRADRESAVRKALSDLLERDITGLFCATEFDLFEFIHAAGRSDGPSLEEVGACVVGVAMDTWLDSLLGPDFAYIHIPAYQIGREGAKLSAIPMNLDEFHSLDVVLPCELRTSRSVAS